MDWLKTILNKFEGLRIRTKILMFYFILVLLSVGISISLYINMTNRYIENTIYELSISEINTNNKSIELLIEDINNFSKALISDIAIQRNLEIDNKSSASHHEIEKILAASIIFDEKISSVYVFDNEGNSYSSEKQTYKDIVLEDIKKISWYQEALEKKGGYILNLNGGGLINEDRTNYFTFIRVINNNKNHQPIGIMMINIKESTVLNVLNLGENEQVLIEIENDAYSTMEDEQSIAYIHDKDYMNRLSHEQIFYEEVVIARTTYSMTGFFNKKYGWKILKMVPNEGRSSMVNSFNGVIISIIFINGVLIIYGSFFIARYITNPIVKLTSLMHDVEEGKFESINVSEHHDEIGSLKAGYNYMIVTIKALIDKVIKEQQTIKKAELRVVMEQIKPHFMYNTLDSISSLIMLNRTDEAYNSLVALSKFYRSSLSDGKLIITISKELDIIKNYLFIQNIRYNNLFEVEIDVDENIMDFKIPKLILQPLIENSLYHGIRPMGMEGLIKIIGKQEGDSITLIVEDNGCGMNNAQLDHIRQMVVYIKNQQSEQGEDMKKISVGIPATIKRIHHMFGAESRFIIDSTNRGTIITIILPLEVQND